MSRSFLILTTLPAPPDHDPSERPAVLSARHEEVLGAWSPAGASSPDEDRSPGPGGTPSRRTFFGFVDRLGRTHSWPGVRPEHRLR
ncbi:MAG TPA: hypothetical protein VGM28_05105 [Candidatus Limnocylindrales bacterium]|jgi:hypothetical protein